MKVSLFSAPFIQQNWACVNLLYTSLLNNCSVMLFICNLTFYLYLIRCGTVSPLCVLLEILVSNLHLFCKKTLVWKTLNYYDVMPKKKYLKMLKVSEENIRNHQRQCQTVGPGLYQSVWTSASEWNIDSVLRSVSAQWRTVFVRKPDGCFFISPALTEKV